MKRAWLFPSALALVALSCAGKRVTEGNGGNGGTGGASGSSGAAGSGAAASGGFGGKPCLTSEGVRLCGGSDEQCGWLGASECPGGGCARPYDRLLGGDAIAGVCFADLPDLGNRTCLGCNDGEVCVERAQGELACVPEAVCAALWALGAKGVCRYADLSAYDGRPLPVLSSCPSTEKTSQLCGGPCKACGTDNPPPCTRRSPDHPQGFCYFNPLWWCALDQSKAYTQHCTFSDHYCGVFHVPAADQVVALQYGHCLGKDYCLQIAAELPGGYDCYDPWGQLAQ